MLLAGLLAAGSLTAAAFWAAPELPQTRKVDCVPAPEVPEDGKDQDCDGADRRTFALVRSGEALYLHNLSYIVDPPVPEGSQLLSSEGGPTLASPGTSGWTFRRIKDDLSLGPPVTSPLRGDLRPGPQPGTALVQEEGSGDLHQLKVETGESSLMVRGLGLREVVGRHGSEDFWGLGLQGGKEHILRKNHLRQVVQRWPLPGPARRLIASVGGLVAFGDFGAAILRDEQLTVLPAPAAEGAALEAAFADPAAPVVWVRYPGRWALVDVEGGRFDFAADIFTHPDGALVPYFPADAVQLALPWDWDLDGAPLMAHRGEDQDDRSPDIAERAGEAPAEGGGAAEASLRWTVLDSLDLSLQPTSWSVTIDGQTWRSEDGSPIQTPQRRGSRGAALVEAPGYVPLLRPYDLQALRGETMALISPQWVVPVARVQSGVRYGSESTSLATIAVDKGDFRSNFPGVTFSVSDPRARSYITDGETVTHDVALTREYGWIFWHGAPPGATMVTVTPPPGARCSLPGAMAALTAPVEVPLRAATITSLWVTCEQTQKP